MYKKYLRRQSNRLIELGILAFLIGKNLQLPLLSALICLKKLHCTRQIVTNERINLLLFLLLQSLERAFNLWQNWQWMLCKWQATMFLEEYSSWNSKRSLNNVLTKTKFAFDRKLAIMLFPMNYAYLLNWSTATLTIIVCRFSKVINASSKLLPPQPALFVGKCI